jgi:hypothetical protein
MTRLRDNRGGVMVLAAVTIPVFLLMTALVVEAGNWFTHKRQLQNRADAAAFAAGVEYGKKWKACVQNGDATLKASTAQEIANAAYQYAANPEAADYTNVSLSGTVPPTVYNDQIARQDPNQANNYLDVVVNSENNDYSDDQDYTDDYDGNSATKNGTPCFLHTSDAEGLSAPGHWTDVKVTERDTAALWQPFSPDLHARARVEIRPAISGTRFLPLAVPNNIIEKVQVRYYDECHGTLLATHDLKPLPAADQAAYATSGGGMLWGLPNVSDPDVGDPNLSFGLTIPAYDSACGDYLAVGTEVRIASRAEIDLNQQCNTLANLRYADCFHRLSQIRVYNDGNPNAEPRILNVRLTGGCGGLADAYFSQLPTAATDCDYDVSVDVHWGTRSENSTNVPANFTVSANGTNLGLVSWTPGGVSTYASSGGALTASAGPNNVTISLNWTDTDTTHSWNGNQCKNGNQNPCKYSGSQTAHRAFVGTKGNAGAVGLVRNSASAFAGGAPSAPFDSTDGGATVQIYPTIGTVTVLKTGVFTTLRLDDPQANQSVFCDPDETQAFPVFLNGCKPWFGANQWAPPWWIDGPSGEKTCPDPGQWYGYGDLGAGFGVNSSFNPWECVLTAPGMKTGQIGDNMAVATDNCDDIQNNSCQVNSFDCNFDGNYDGKPGDLNGWVQQGGDSRYPRVVNLFIVPYQSSKGLTGNGDPIPILGFASFYVMNWTGSNNKQDDPCPDTDWDHDGDPNTPQITVPTPPAGAVTGVFVETVDYEPGPVDPNATCVEGQLTPCRAVLVR